MGFLNYFIIGLAVITLNVNYLICQEDPAPPDEPNQDTTSNERVSILPDDDFEFSFKNKDFKFKMSSPSNLMWKPEKPLINFEFGQAGFSNADFDGIQFKPSPALSLILGYYKDANKTQSTLYSSKTSEVFVAYYSDKLWDLKENAKGYGTENWQFGVNWGEGYGNEFHKNFKIYFNHKSGYSWTRFKLSDRGSIEDTIFVSRFDRYNETFKFGEQFQSTGSIVLFDLINLNASYQKIHVYPAHMFWYWSLSEIIESAAHSLLDEFVDEIKKFSPELTPLFNILLKTGLSYGAYELKRNNMNWPVNTEPPFVIENFKVGLGFNF